MKNFIFQKTLNLPSASGKARFFSKGGVTFSVEVPKPLNKFLKKFPQSSIFPLPPSPWLLSKLQFSIKKVSRNISSLQFLIRIFSQHSTFIWDTLYTMLKVNSSLFHVSTPHKILPHFPSTA